MAETKKAAVVKPAAKAVAVKAAEVKNEEVKTEAVKEAPKAETKKSAAKKTTKKESKKATAEKTTKTRAKKAAEAEVVIQFAGNDYTTERLVSIAKDVWQYDLNREPADFKTVKLYVKMEEQLVYYVINDEVSGSFGI
ncbi:MAG: DNA-binding protein [Lachnospiraceae bacterium]|nr:DNA-binding protein [Lachnospiraceae bacterium]